MGKLKHTKSSAPISPIANSPLKLNSFDTNTSGIANWKYWKHVTTVELWQALLLSLNINPPGNGWLIDNAAGRTGDIPFAYLDKHGLTDVFNGRWKLIKNKLEHYRSLARLTPTIELTSFITLSFFAKLAVDFEWDNLPSELLRLATEAAPIAQTNNLTAKSEVIKPIQRGAKKHFKLNRNALDPSIDVAIRQAGNMELADVFLKLKELAINGTSPFTGLIECGALCYTNSNDKSDKLTKNALGKRLKIRRVNAV